MTLQVISLLFCVVIVAMITTRIIEARRDREDEITNIHRRIDEANREWRETLSELDRLIDDRITRLQEKVQEEYISTQNKMNSFISDGK